MTNEIATKNSSYVARYENTKDPYAAFADEGGPGIQGKLLQCKKGEWVIGADNDTVKPGTLYLAVVPSSMRGWLKWVDNVVVDARMGLIAENFLVPHRYALGDTVEDAWQKNPDGTPRDPWSKCYRLLLIEMAPPHGDVTFSGSSYGAQLALKELCRAYSSDSPLYKDAFPVVALGTKSRSKAYGKIVGPSFEVASARRLATRSPDGATKKKGRRGGAPAANV